MIQGKIEGTLKNMSTLFYAGQTWKNVFNVPVKTMENLTAYYAMMYATTKFVI